jgi:hypothetical protein
VPSGWRNPTKTQCLLQSLHVLYNTINEKSSTMYRPKTDLVVTISLEFLDKYGM